MAIAVPLKIGPIEVSPGLLLAPMEDVSDLPFRVICKRMGANIVYTEFVNAEGLIRSEDALGRARRKLAFLEEERPIGIQLYGASDLSMEQAARIAASLEPDILDINCGCWVSNVALRGAGAGLLREPTRMRDVVKRVIGVTDRPVTVKTRLGWDGDSIRIVEVARMLEDIGVRALTVHCRTRAQGHKGAVDYDWIPRIKEAVAIPVIVNGDINSAEDVKEAFEATGSDAVMIGRGAIRHPWIFRESLEFLNSGQQPPPPSMAERIRLCQEHLHLSVEHKGERGGVIGMRRHYAGYFRDLPQVSLLRAELVQQKTVRDVEDRLAQLGETAGETVSETASQDSSARETAAAA